MATCKHRGQDGEIDCLDPKAVTNDELFGVLNKAKEFKNGCLSAIIKAQCKDQGKYRPSHVNKWIILDGDIDPEWIESLNTVMDDNKVLTLVSNDRFPLTKSMRLLFEISNLRSATPATVSRAGVLFINDTDIGWAPYYESWLESHKLDRIKELEESESAFIPRACFDQIAQSVFLKCQPLIENNDITRLKRVCPIVDMAMLETTCCIIDQLVLNNADIMKTKKEDDQKICYEGIFLYAAMWGFGGAFVESGEDEFWYKDFSRLWKSQAKNPKYPDLTDSNNKAHSIFDFYFDCTSQNWELWDISTYDFPEEPIFSKLFVPTLYTTRLKFLLNLHVGRKQPLLFVGSAGTGKTALINDYMECLTDENLIKTTINFSSKTTSASLQENIMGSGLSKLGMRLWGLGSGKTMIFFVDDINMPYVDKYSTQAPIALMRQIHDYGIVYDRENLEEYNKLQDLYFVSCLNPKAGSFNIELRLQRHFSVFTLPVANEGIIKSIYKQILNGHFASFEGLGDLPDK